MLRYDIIQLRASSAGRPEGYVEFVLQHGKIEGGFVLLADSVQNELPKRFPPAEFKIAQLKADAERLPKGFADFVLSRGTRKGSTVELDLELLDELHENFRLTDRNLLF